MFEASPLLIAAIYESVRYAKKEGSQALPCIGCLQKFRLNRSFGTGAVARGIAPLLFRRFLEMTAPL